jgi:hypothetical protein
VKSVPEAVPISTFHYILLCELLEQRVIEICSRYLGKILNKSKTCERAKCPPMEQDSRKGKRGTLQAESSASCLLWQGCLPLSRAPCPIEATPRAASPRAAPAVQAARPLPPVLSVRCGACRRPTGGIQRWPAAGAGRAGRPQARASAGRVAAGWQGVGGRSRWKRPFDFPIPRWGDGVGARGGSSGHTTCMRRQINTRATSRSW